MCLVATSECHWHRLGPGKASRVEKIKISHVATDQRAKIPVGFAQAAMPIIPSSSYFEVEVCSLCRQGHSRRPCLKDIPSLHGWGGNPTHHLTMGTFSQGVACSVTK